MATFICPDIGPTSYFTQPFENLLIQYIYNEWSIANPAKPAEMQGADQDMTFRPGYLAEQPTYQILTVQRETNPIGDPLMIGQTALSLLTTVEVMIRMRRLIPANADPDEPIFGIDPQYWNMEQEVLRIVGQYDKNPQDIAGIKNLIFLGMNRLDDPNPTWAKSEWRTVMRVGMWYEVRDVSS